MQLLESYGLALAGGALVGLAAASVLLFHGRIAGVGGMFGGLFLPGYDARAKRLIFLLGLVAGGVGWSRLSHAGPSAPVATLPVIVVAGVLVGYGAKLMNGCTSGHAICGIPRLSIRSIVATSIFMASGILTVMVVRVLGVGR